MSGYIHRPEILKLPAPAESATGQSAPTPGGFRQEADGGVIDNEVDISNLNDFSRHLIRLVYNDGRPEDRNTAELLSNLRPTDAVSIGEKSFLLSEVLSSGLYKHCVGYVSLRDGHVAPRLFYKSRSEGDWRVTPMVIGLQYSKGEVLPYGYVRETQLHPTLSDALHTKEGETSVLSRDGLRWVRDHFTAEKIGANDTYEEEVHGVYLKALSQEGWAFMPGHGFDTNSGEPARETFKRVSISYDASPDFLRQPLGASITEHALLGEVITEEYSSTDERLVWSMSYDTAGRVWPSGARNASIDRSTSYGTDEEIVLTGVLDNKPLEYRQQIDGLDVGTDYVPIEESSYVDITPLMDNLPIVQQFREQRGIERRVK